MKAIVVEQPGGPGVLQIQERPMPKARPGWVLVHVRGFGLKHRLDAIGRFGDHLHVGLRADGGGQPHSDHDMVVDEEDANTARR